MAIGEHKEFKDDTAYQEVGASSYVVGKLPDDGQWQIQGIYTNESTAIKSCEDWHWFVMPIETDKSLPSEPVETGYYPMGEAVKINIKIDSSNCKGFIFSDKQVDSIIEAVNAN